VDGIAEELLPLGRTLAPRQAEVRCMVR
jgi:hypothetical protein